MKPTEQKLLTLMKKNRPVFKIPPFQRGYEWGTELCDVFLNDVINTATDNRRTIKTQHFFGTITFYREDDRIVLVDGQQRITTTMLLLAAIRDLLKDEEKKERINRDFLKNPDMLFKMRIEQVDEDKGPFGNIILEKELTQAHKNKSDAIYRNWSRFKSQLENESQTTLWSLIEKGLEQFSLVTIELFPEKNNWERPQEIFESMNSLGEELKLDDLVRNYLLLGISAREQEAWYKTYWGEIKDRLGGATSAFIRDYMQFRNQEWVNAPSSRVKNGNHKVLYNEFKRMFKKEDTSEVFETLNRYSEYYAYIVKGLESGDTIVDDKLADIRRLGIATPNPLLLAMMASWKEGRLKDEDIRDLLDVLNIYFTRRKIVGLGQGENKAIPRLLKRMPEIERGRSKRDKLFKILSSQERALRLPNDKEIKEALMEGNFYNQKYTRHVFMLMEEKWSKARLSDKDKKITIEHIMPQTLNQTWRTELGSKYKAIHETYINNIGNLTLIRHNSELKNYSFKDKKEIYEGKKKIAGRRGKQANERAESLVIARQWITDCPKWGKKEIEKRRDEIIKLLCNEILIIPRELRKAENYKSERGAISDTE